MYLPVVWHADPAHEWLEVRTADLARVGLSLTSFSKYSYRTGDNEKVYLEGDMDAEVFIVAAARYGASLTTNSSMEIPTRQYDGECFVRALPRIR